MGILSTLTLLFWTPAIEIVVLALVPHHKASQLRFTANLFTALAGAILGTAYMLSFKRRAFFGPVVHQTVSKVHDLQTRELVLLSISALLILVFGFFSDYVP